MRIKMLALMCSPAGVARPGDIIDRPDYEAAALMRAGYAVAVDPPAPPPAPPPPEPIDPAAAVKAALRNTPRTATRPAGRTAAKP